MPEFVALRGEVAANGSRVLALGRGGRAQAQMHERPADCRQVEDLVPPEAVETFRAVALVGNGGLLLLEESLPAPWLALDWESLTITGRVLGKSFLVIRRARPTFGTAMPVSKSAASLLNLFPPAEFDFNRHLEDLVEQEHLRATTRESFADDVARARDLFVIAHASERGLEDRFGRPYSLPPAAALPERVWLLACNKAGAMDALARQLLERGAGCVISATGDLSAPEMLNAVREWLLSYGDEELASWLLANRTPKGVDGGIGALRLWGNVCVDTSTSAIWNSVAWKVDHGSEDCRVLDGDTSNAEYFSAATAYHAPETWSLTRAWMAPRLLWLAERYDHPSMAVFESAVLQKTAGDFEALSSSARRWGHYPQAARYLARGFCLPGLSESGKAVLLGNLTNVLIDLNLPKSARAAESAFEDCVVVDLQTRADNDFKRLDFLARIAAREGKIQVALDRMREKQALALAKGDDSRELAGLLYLTAWAVLSGENELQVAKTLAAEVLNRISVTTSQQIGKGNETTAYLLRALAAYFWASQDGTVLPHLKRWQPFAEDCLRSDDPGPWSYMLAFMHLANRIEKSLFDRAMGTLERARYFLESAMFYLLAGRNDDCLHALSRFNQRRLRTIVELPALQTNRGCDPVAEALARSDTENRSTRNPGEMTMMGLMPL